MDPTVGVLAASPVVLVALLAWTHWHVYQWGVASQDDHVDELLARLAANEADAAADEDAVRAQERVAQDVADALRVPDRSERRRLLLAAGAVARSWGPDPAPTGPERGADPAPGPVGGPS